MATRGKKKADDFDNPWQEVLVKKFEFFLRFFFPDVHADINWKRKLEFLDKEFRSIARKARSDKRNADALIKVFLKDGREQWVLIHVEIQAQSDAAFAERMYIYNYRIYDRYKQSVSSFAILADEDELWRPTRFEHGRWGSRSCLEFNTVKLLDLKHDVDALINHENPFATLVLAHFKTQETRNDPSARYTWKRSLLKNLFRYGMHKEDVEDLIRFIDWIMYLPDNEQSLFVEDLLQLEERKTMPYVTTFERYGLKRGKVLGRKLGRKEGHKEGRLEGRVEGHVEGREEGRMEALQEGELKGMQIAKETLQKSIIDILSKRFGMISGRFCKSIQSVDDIDKLTELVARAGSVESLKEFSIK